FEDSRDRGGIERVRPEAVYGFRGKGDKSAAAEYGRCGANYSGIAGGLPCVRRYSCHTSGRLLSARCARLQSLAKCNAKVAHSFHRCPRFFDVRMHSRVTVINGKLSQEFGIRPQAAETNVDRNCQRQERRKIVNLCE